MSAMSLTLLSVPEKLWRSRQRGHGKDKELFTISQEFPWDIKVKGKSIKCFERKLIN